MLCIVNGCPTKAVGKQMCQKHYVRWKKHGSSDVVARAGPKVRPPEERFWALVDKGYEDPACCWPWKNGTEIDRYYVFHLTPSERSISSHRMAYILTFGDIANSLVIDHLCEIKICVNPYHLEPVTQRENLIRSGNVIMDNAGKTHCLRGHEFTAENTWRNHKGHRWCRECTRIRQRK